MIFLALYQKRTEILFGIKYYILWSLYFSTRSICHFADIDTRNKLLIQNFFNKINSIIKFRNCFLNFNADIMI